MVPSVSARSAMTRCLVGPALLFEGALVLLAVAMGRAVGIAPFGSATWSWSAAGLATLVTLPPLAGLWVSLRVDWPSFRRLRALVDQFVSGLFARCGPVGLLLISAAAGVGEESLFRGVIQPAIGNWVGDVGGLLVASALFGLAHAVSGLYAVLAGLMGLYLGAVFLATGNIVLPILVHSLYDFGALWYLVKRRSAGADNQAASGESR